MYPSRRPVTYLGSLATPCDSIPRKSAITSTSVVTWASSLETPCLMKICSQKCCRSFSEILTCWLSGGTVINCQQAERNDRVLIILIAELNSVGSDIWHILEVCSEPRSDPD